MRANSVLPNDADSVQHASAWDDLLGADPTPLDAPFRFTTFADGQARDRTERSATLRDLAGSVHAPTSATKAGLPWLKLARFGDARTDKGSLRHNANLLEITGIEGDYDAEELTLEAAAARLRSANIAALLYTSPSHTPERPRWRVLCPLNRPTSPADRERFCARLNGALGGALSGESFTLSQSYYYGSVRGAAQPETVLVDGRAIDTAPELDAKAIGRDGRPYQPQALKLIASAPPTSDDDDDWDYKPLPDWDRIDAALASIPVTDADAPETGGRDMWLRIGQALHHVSSGSDDAFVRWDAWSRGGVKYKAQSVAHTWQSLGRGSGKRVGIGTLFDLAKRYGAASEADPIDSIGAEQSSKPPLALPLIDPADWHGLELPPREWALKEWIPFGQATYLTGPGSAGKSLLAQQLATCIALGLPFLGIETREARALYLTCEDDALELHRRQIAICAALNVPLRDLSDRLFLASLTGETDTELCTFTDKGELRATPRYASLEAGALSKGITFVALDNVAHLFAGNENARHDVASFVSLLNRLAMRIGGTVLFIGHPNKAGDSFSGSTAWENQVRSRLFMESPTDATGAQVDRDTRVLSRQKANYARNGEQVRFRWHEWAFARDTDLPDAVSEASRARHEDQGFMACLAKAASELRAVSPNASASNYAPRIFAKMLMGQHIGLHGFEKALQRLLDSGAILNGQRVYQRDNRSWATGLAPARSSHGDIDAFDACDDVDEAAQTPAQTPHKPMHEPCTNHSTNPAQTRAHAPPYTTYTGAAFEPPRSVYPNGKIDPFDAANGAST